MVLNEQQKVMSPYPASQLETYLHLPKQVQIPQDWAYSHFFQTHVILKNLTEESNMGQNLMVVPDTGVEEAYNSEKDGSNEVDIDKISEHQLGTLIKELQEEYKLQK